MFPDLSRNFRAPGEGRESRSYRDGRGTSGLCIVRFSCPRHNEFVTCVGPSRLPRSPYAVLLRFALTPTRLVGVSRVRLRDKGGIFPPVFESSSFCVFCTPVASTGANVLIRTIRTSLRPLHPRVNPFFSSPSSRRFPPQRAPSFVLPSQVYFLSCECNRS